MAIVEVEPAAAHPEPVHAEHHDEQHGGDTLPDDVDAAPHRGSKPRAYRVAGSVSGELRH